MGALTWGEKKDSNNADGAYSEQWDFSSGEKKKKMEKLESTFLVSKDLIGIGKFHPGTSEESWSAFSLSIPTPSCTLGSFSTGFGYPQIQTF